jgi:hypothetical protein
MYRHGHTQKYTKTQLRALYFNLEKKSAVLIFEGLLDGRNSKVKTK